VNHNWSNIMLQNSELIHLALGVNKQKYNSMAHTNCKTVFFSLHSFPKEKYKHIRLVSSLCIVPLPNHKQTDQYSWNLVEMFNHWRSAPPSQLLIPITVTILQTYKLVKWQWYQYHLMLDPELWTVTDLRKIWNFIKVVYLSIL
jgi:hypothetical protein